MRVETPSPVTFALRIRKPAGVTRQIEIERHRPAGDADDNGYWTCKREWQHGDSLQLFLDMPVRRMIAHPHIASGRGKVALQRGPLVYGFEGLDNQDNARIVLGPDPRFRVEHRPELLGGVSVIRGVAADGQPILAVPFYALANRGKSAQEVWVAQAGLKATDAWWLGALYRPVAGP
jgi:DUF1680 family protein